MRVIVAEPPIEGNVCIGISRSIERIRTTVNERGTVFSFEPSHEMELRKSGQKVLAAVSALEASMEDVHAHYPELQRVEMVDTLDAITDGFMVVSARGIPPSVMEEAKGRDMEVLNTTCPFVMSQENYATKLVNDGYDIVYCGAGAQHGVPRLRDIVERAGKRFWIAEHEEDVKDVPKLSKVGVMAQTTQSLENLQAVVARLLEKCHEVKVVNSICGDAIPRQAAAREVAEQVDVVVVIGESWGASRVAEVCKNANPRTYRAVTPDELKSEWFEGAGAVGICPGNATPQFMIDRFVEQISQLPASACTHLESVKTDTPRTPEGCEECLRTGDEWVHLRLCLACGHVGCCDNSKNRHATRHFRSTSHPIIRSFEPGEEWGWCYVDEMAFEQAPKPLTG